MNPPQRLCSVLNSTIGRQILTLRSSSSSSTSSTWSNNKGLAEKDKPELSKTNLASIVIPGGFNADGLREWAVITDFGADGYENMTGQEMRKRRRQVSDDPKDQLYADLFSKRVSDECSQYLASHPSPSGVLGRAFFGSRSFMGEKMVLSSINLLLSLYPDTATSLPTHFKLNEQYLQWKVTMKAPLELICSYQIGGLNLKGCTMLAYDPSVRKAYHGNCIDMTEGRLQGFLPEMGVRMHTDYARFLLDGMASELEQEVINQNEVDQ